MLEVYIFLFKKMKKVFLIIVFIYLAITMFYCLPSNPMKIKYNIVSRTWNILFPQNWSFFAPPPQFNLKLYYRFYDGKGALINQKDAVSILWKLKRERAPFNSDEEVMDYLIGSSLATLNTFNNNLIKSIKYQYRDSININFTEKFNDTVQSMLDNNIYKGVPVFNTLSNYGLVLSKSAKNAKSFDFIITTQEIPKYIDRYKIIDSLFRVEEKLLFTSDLKSIDDFKYSYTFR